VAVPSKASLDAVPSHGLISGENIFNRTGDKVAEVRQTGREGRAVVEHEFRRTFPLRNGLLEYLSLFPKLYDRFFLLREVDLGVNGFIHDILLDNLRNNAVCCERFQ